MDVHGNAAGQNVHGIADAIVSQVDKAVPNDDFNHGGASFRRRNRERMHPFSAMIIGCSYSIFAARKRRSFPGGREPGNTPHLYKMADSRYDKEEI